MRANLLRKHLALYGTEPARPCLRLYFDRNYMQRDAHEGARKMRFKNVDVVGAFCPLRLEGSPELLRLAWECGLGEKNAAGFGMLEMIRPVSARPTAV